MSESPVTNTCPVKGMKKKRKVKLRKWRIRIEDRFEAIDLLASGITIDQVVERMAKKHPDWPLEKVRSIYFPKGLYSISQFAGASVEEASVAKERLAKIHAINQRSAAMVMTELHKDPVFAAETSQRSRLMMIELHKDPVFVAARDENLRKGREDPVVVAKNTKRIKGLWKDPEFVEKIRVGKARYWTQEKRAQLGKVMRVRRKKPEFIAALLTSLPKSWTTERRVAASQRMLVQLEDPDFVAARDAGLGRYRNTHRMRLASALEDQGIYLIDQQTGKPNKWKAVGNIKTPAQIAMSRERRRVITSAISLLDPFGREVIELFFFTDRVEPITVAEGAVILGCLEEEVDYTLKFTMEILADNRQLQEII